MKIKLKQILLTLCSIAFCTILMPKINVFAATVNEIEPNDYKVAATKINLGDTVHGDFYGNNGDDEDDWYAIALVKGTKYGFNFPDFFLISIKPL